MLDPNRYDPTVSHAINARRREERQRQFYADVVSADASARRLAEFEQRSIMKGQIAYINMRMADLVQKTKLAVEGRRTRLKALYDREFRDYQDAVRASLPTEEDRIRQMEREYAEVTGKIAARKAQTTAAAQERQWELNCDELRAAASLLNARACKLAWDAANCERIKKRERDRAETRFWQDQVNEGYREHVEETLRREAEDRARIMDNRKQLEQQLSERERQRAEEAYRAQLEREHEKEQRQLGEELDELARQREFEERYLQQQQFLIRMRMDEAERERNRVTAQNDGRELLAQVREELRQQAERERQAREDLRNEQLMYLELLRIRRERADAAARARDAYLTGMILDADARLTQREKDDLARRERVARECQAYNYEKMCGGEEERERMKADKEAELAEALAELEQAEREKLEALQEQFEVAKRFEQFLLEQMDEKAAREQAERDADAAFQRKKREEAEADQARIDARLGALEARIREVDDIRFFDNERPRPKKQWYN